MNLLTKECGRVGGKPNLVDEDVEPRTDIKSMLHLIQLCIC